MQKCSNKSIQRTKTLKTCSKHLLTKNTHSLAPTNVIKSHSHASTHTYTHSSGTQPHSWGPASSTPTKLAQFLIVRGGNAAAAVDIAGPVLHHLPGALQSEGPAFDSVALRLHLPDGLPSPASAGQSSLSVPSPTAFRVLGVL